MKKQRNKSFVVLYDFDGFNWAKGTYLAEALRNFKTVHGKDYKFFTEDGQQNPVYLITNVSDGDKVYVDDEGQLHYPKGSMIQGL